MKWNLAKQHLQGSASDLIEAHFYDLTRESWADLFCWIKNKLQLLDNQHGRTNTNELDLDLFLGEKMSYIARIHMDDGYELSLSIIEPNELIIDIEIGEVNTEEKFKMFLKNIIHIASILNCRHYIICPELEPDKAFVVNGCLKSNSDK